jgi:hypothetical protein
VPETPALHLVEPHLDDDLGSNRCLFQLARAPAVRLGETALWGILEQREDALGDLGVATWRDRGGADVVEVTVVVVQAQEEGRDRGGLCLPAQADDDAVGGAVTLHLEHALARAREVGEGESLADHSVEPDRIEAVQPFLGLIGVACGR